MVIRCRIALGEDQPFLEIVKELIRAYGKALHLGHKHIYQAMPRMLTVWFDFGNYCLQAKQKSVKVFFPRTLVFKARATVDVCSLDLSAWV